MACTLLLMAVPGCARREEPAQALARSRAAQLQEQIQALEAMLARAERGNLSATDQIAIGLSEELAARLLNASLPIETVVASRLRVRLESALPQFRGTKATLAFAASVASLDIERASAVLEIGGTLEDYQLEGGRLRARVGLDHVRVVESGAGDLAADVLETVLRGNAAVIESVIPFVEFPVELDDSIAVPGLSQGAVVAGAGEVPLEMALRMVIPNDGMLWVLLDARTGRWQPATPDEASALGEPGEAT